MSAKGQSELESWRLILLDSERQAIIAMANERGSGFCLPSVEIPRGQRIAEALTQAVKRSLHCDAVCLFVPTDVGPDTFNYAVMERQQDSEETSNCRSLPFHDLNVSSFQDAGDFQFVQQGLAELKNLEDDTLAPFIQRGWFQNLQIWVADLLKPFELKLTGQFHQLNACPTFSLVRFGTTGPDVWFKAVGEPNLREFPITLELSRRFSAYLPKIIGQRPEWNGWLAFSAGSRSLSETGDFECWTAALRAFASLQVETHESIESLLDAGAHDLKLTKLSESIHPFLGVVNRLMQEQTKASPNPLSDDDLGLLGLRLEDAITLLEDLRIPNALGHLDLNPGNIVPGAEGCKFLDWAEAYVGHPFFSFEYLLAHWRRIGGAAPEIESSLLEAYMEPWSQVLSRDVIAEAFAFVPIVAVFAYAVGLRGWRDEDALADPKIAGYIRSLARRMHREAAQLNDRREPCLN